MADQATLIGANGSAGSVRPGVDDPGFGRQSGAPLGTEAAAGQVVSNVAGFGENLLNLAELQAQMTAAELRQNVEAVKFAAAVLVVGTLIALATLPVIVAGIAELFVSELGWRRGYALLTVGSTVIGVAALCAVTAGVRLRRQRLGFPLSAEELTRNLNWVRTVLRLSGRRPSRRS
jgi:hypothetical protein